MNDSNPMKPAPDCAEVSFPDQLVSVIIPTFNRAWSLADTVRSVFRQTYRPIECVIVDDGSTDATQEIVAELAEDAPEGILVHCFHQPNAGASSARNLGHEKCRGVYVCYLDSDDTLESESVEVRARVLVDNPDVDLCYGWGRIRDEAGTKDIPMNLPWPAEGEAVIAPYLFHTNAPMVRRSLLGRAGFWRSEDRFGLEYEYFARLKYFARRVRFIDQTLSIYVRHDKELLFDAKSRACGLERFRAALAVKGLVLYSPYDSRGERAELATQFRNVAKHLYRVKDYSTACAALREALVLKWRFMDVGYWVAVKALQLTRGVGRKSEV